MANEAPAQHDESHSFISHAKVVGALTLISRFAGLARDAVCAKVFGAGPVWSAFALAFAIPHLFRRLFGEGALSAAFLPEYTRLSDADPALARRFATIVIGGLAAALGAVTLISEVGLLIALRYWANGDAPAERSLVLQLTMIMLPYMPLVCLVALLGAMLQARGRFGPTAAMPIVLNGFIIVAATLGAIWWPIDESASGGDDRAMLTRVMIVAISVALAGAAQVAWSLFALRRERPFDIRLGGRGDDAASRSLTIEAGRVARRMLRVMTPMLLGLGVLQFNTFLDQLIASYPISVGDTIFGYAYPLDKQSEAVIYYANRLYQFPLGVFGIAVATAIFPALSRSVGRSDSFGLTLRQGLRLTMFIGLPASAGLALVRESLTAVIFQGGEFDAADVERVASVVFAYAFGVWAYSINQVLVRAYYAQGNALKPVKIAIGLMLLNLALNMTLIWFVGEAGLAWSTSFCAMLQTLLLLAGLRRYADRVVNADVLRSWLMSLIAAAAMSIIVWLVGLAFRDVDGGWTWRAIELAALVISGMGAFLLAASLMRMDEVAWLLRRRVGEVRLGEAGEAGD